jgi:hypothetical protein
MSASSSSQPPSAPAPRPPGWDALAEDLFGLNIRGLRTMGALIRDPKPVFLAARETGWQDRFTPSIRLAVSLVALFTFLRFIWGSDSSGLFAVQLGAMSEVADSRPELLGGRDPLTATEDYFTNFLVAFPFVYVATHGLLSLVLNIWGKGTRLAVRTRLYFAVLVPVLVLGVVSSGAYAMLSGAAMIALTFASTGVSALIYAATYARGMRDQYSGTALYARAGAASAAMFAGDLIVSAIASLIGFAALAWIPVAAG